MFFKLKFPLVLRSRFEVEERRAKHWENLHDKCFIRANDYFCEIDKLQKSNQGLKGDFKKLSIEKKNLKEALSQRIEGHKSDVKVLEDRIEKLKKQANSVGLVRDPKTGRFKSYD